MSEREIDAEDVLASYGRLLEAGGGLIRDASDLPYPKGIIKQVLNHCLRLSDERSRDYLTMAYMQLAAFVPLSSDERIAVETFEKSVEASELMPDAMLVGNIARHGEIYTALQAKVSAEMSALRAEAEGLVTTKPVKAVSTSINAFKDTNTMCFSNITLDDGSPCFVSVARSGVIVKQSRMGWFGATLYSEKVAYSAAMTAKALTFLFPNRKIPAGMSNTILSGFTNAVLHCATPSEVTRVLNTAIAEAERTSGQSIDALPVLPHSG